MLYRRRLPHVRVADRPVFLTWRLHGSLPPERWFAGGTLTSVGAFAALDGLLDEARAGPLYLREPELADMVAEAIVYSETVLRRYDLHAFVVMPNHVHLLVTAAVPVPAVTQSLKGFTARRANAMLGLAGRPFWQQESYDYTARDERDVERIREYIEANPVRAGLVREARDYRWSTAGWPTWRSPGGPGDPPP